MWPHNSPIETNYGTQTMNTSNRVMKKARNKTHAVAMCVELGGVESTVSGKLTYTFADGSVVQFSFNEWDKFDTWNGFANAAQQQAHNAIYDPINEKLAKQRAWQDARNSK